MNAKHNKIGSKAMREVDLGDDGRAYIEESISGRPDVHSRVKALLQLPGRIFAPLPQEMDRSRIKLFDQGGLGGRSYRISWLLGALESRSAGTLVIFDIWAKVSDFRNSITDPPRNVRFVGESVFLLFKTSGINESVLRGILKRPTSFNIACFFVQEDLLADLSGVLTQNVVGTSYLEALVSPATLLCSSAYDQESWVVWEKDH